MTSMRATASLARARCRILPMSDTAPPALDRDGFVDVGAGVRIGYRRVGTGPDTILVLQGGPGFTMDYLADDLLPLAQRHTIVFHDPRGSGRSTLVADAAELDAQRLVDDVDALRQHLGLRRLTLLGHSWGAGVAALYALRFPQSVERMIVVGGIPLESAELARVLGAIQAGGDAAWRARLRQRRAEWLAEPGSAAACRAYYETWYVPFFADAAALRLSKGDFCAGGADSLRNKLANVDRVVLASLGEYDWRPGLKEVQAPTLVIHGAADPIPATSATQWAETMPNARLLLMDGVGHFPYLESPDLFFEAVERFICGEWPRGARTP